MKRLLVSATALLIAFSFVGCVKDEPPQPQRRGGYRPPPPPLDEPVDRGSNEPSEPTPPPDRGATSDPSPPSPPQPTLKNYEYGKPVPGKPGFVTSPYAPAQGYVDVRGFAPGTEVKDPYTGKVFLVP